MALHTSPRLSPSASLLLGTCLAAPALAGEPTLLLDEIVVSTDRAGGTPLDIAANVTVISAEELNTRGVKDLEDLLRNVPGVTISRQTSATDPFNTIGGITIRGVGGNRVALQVDGARVAERITDGTRDYVDFSFTRQAEVVRGPASVKWGADALGGLLALQTLDPEDVLQGNDRAGTTKLSYDSVTRGTQAEAMLAQRFSDQLSVLLGVKRGEAHEIEKSNARADGGAYV